MSVSPQRLAELEENKLKRARLRTLIMSDPSVRAEIYERCKNDPKFFAEMCCWALDEQTIGMQKEIPLVLYPFQEEMLLSFCENALRCAHDPVARWNCGADKARGMAATFTFLLGALWLAIFHGVSTAITSKTEEDVDRKEDMNTPFERLRWQMMMVWNTYPWLFPPGFDPSNKETNKTKLLNFGNGGQITGMAPTAKALRQARALIWIGDEFAWVDQDYEVWEASSGTVRVRVVLSTPRDQFCKYYRLIAKKDGVEITVFELDWWKHPERARGLYKKPDGSYSSPWFDEILRTESAQTIAREFLRDHNASIGGRVFEVFRSDSCVPGLRPSEKNRIIYRIWDPGLTFAVTWGQPDDDGHMRCLHELVRVHDQISKSDTLLNKIAQEAINITEAYFNDYEVIDLGDPYGSRKQIASQEKTEYELLDENFGIKVNSAYVYAIASHERKSKGIEIMCNLMTRIIETTGKPAFLINPDTCPITLEAIKGGYRRVVSKSGEVQDEIADNHPFTDVVDCWRYLAIKAFYNRQSAAIPERPRREATKWRRTMRRNIWYG